MNAAFRNAVYQFEPPTQPMPHMLAAATQVARPAAPLDSLEAAEEVAAAIAAGMDSAAGDDQKDQGLPPDIHSTPAHLHHIQSIFTHLQHSRQAPYDPSHLVTSLKLSVTEQQDVHEFMNLLVFQVLEGALLASSNPICKQLIPKLFTGSLVNVMEGQSCHHTSERVSEFHDLSQVQIKGKKKLEECLDSYFQPERMEHDKPEYRWKCSECGQRENAVRHTYLKDPPPILILQLGRFEFDANTMSKKKLADSIKLPQFLDLTKYLQPPKKDATNAAASAPTASSASASDTAAPPATTAAVETSAIPAAAASPTMSPAASPVIASTAALEESAASAEPAAAPPKRGGRAAPAAAAPKPAKQSRKRPSATLVDDAVPAALVAAVEAAVPEESVSRPALPISSLSSLKVHPVSAAAAASTTPTGKTRGRKPAASKKGKGRGRKKAGGDEEEEPALADASETAMVDAAVPSPIDLTGDAPVLAPAIAPIAPGLARIVAPPPAERDRALAGTAPSASAAAASEAASSSPVAAAEAKAMADDEAMARALQAEEEGNRAKAGRRAASTKQPRKTAAARAAAATGSKETPLDVDVDADHPAPKQQKTKKDQSANKRLSKKEAAAIAAAQAADSSAPAPDADAAELAVDGVTIDSSTAQHLDLSGPNIYELVAVILHKGPSANRGHYTAEIKDLERPGGEWYTFDDGKVTRKGAKKKKTEEAKQQENMSDAAVATETPAAMSATAAPASPALIPAPAPAPAAANGVVPMDEDDAPRSTPAATPATAASDDSSVVAISLAAPTADSAAKPDIIDVDAESDVEPATTTPKGKAKGRPGRKKKMAAASETESAAPPRSKRAASQVAAARIMTEAALDAAPSPSPTPSVSPDAPAATAAATSKRPGRASASASKKFTDLDDEERGDEADYNPDEDAAEEKPKKGRGKKATAAETKAKKGEKATKADKKADVSVGAASTAYVLIYRRRDTMRPDWNPFATEEAEMRLLADAGSSAMVDANEGAPVASVAAPSTASGSIFLQSKAPSIFLGPVLEANTAFAREQQQFDEREAHLLKAVEERQKLAEQIMAELQPDRFEVVARSLEHYAPQQQAAPPSQTAAATKVESPTATPDTPTSSASSVAGSARRSARKSTPALPAGAPTSKPEAPPSTPPVDAESDAPIKPLSELQMGHYVPTAWLAAFLTGWVIEKDKEEAAAEAAAVAAAAAAAKEELKERETEDLTGDAKEADEEMMDEPKAEAAAAVVDTGVAPASSSSAAAAASAAHAAASAASVPAPRARTALQLFLDSHPDNADLPFPGDLLDHSQSVLCCEHGKLNPLKLSSAKRISCKAWVHLMDANARWKAEQQPQQDAKMKGEEKGEQSHTMDRDRLQPPVGAIKTEESPASSPSPTQLNHLHISCSAAAAASSSSSAIATAAAPCTCLSCHALGFTDADLCQQCARQSLLGETELADQWTKAREIWDRYVEWDKAQTEADKSAEKQPAFEKGFHVSSAWWKTLKKELDLAAKALGFPTIVPVKAKKAGAKGGAAAAAAAAAAASGSSIPTAPKPLPKIGQNLDITADIICPHGGLKPPKPGSKSTATASFQVPPDIWKMMLKLHPNSRPVPAATAALVEGEEPMHECPMCVSEAAQAASSLKGRRDKIKSEKGKLKFIKSRAAFSDFPVQNKAPTDGVYHIVPAPWAEQLYDYFSINTQAAAAADSWLDRPKPLSTAELLCKHGKLLFNPMPEDDKSILPTVAIAAAAVASGATPPAAAAGSSTSPCGTAAASAAPAPVSSPPPLPTLKLRARCTAPGILALCDDADYRHLLSQNWVDPDSRDVKLTVAKNPRNIIGDLGVSSWLGLDIACDPPACDEGCILERVKAEHHDSLDFENETLKLYRIKPDEKVQNEEILALGNALNNGWRASTRRRVPATGRAVSKKPIEVRASSSDKVYILKMRVFEACSLDMLHQEIIWLKEDQCQ